MKELKCPHCGSVFTVDEADYASIVNQVKNVEFQIEIDHRLKELHKQHIAEQESEVLKVEQSFQNKLSTKELELSKKDTEIAKLNERVNSIAQSKQLEYNEELARKEQEISKLKAAIEQKNSNIKIAVLEEQGKTQKMLQAKEEQLAELKNRMISEQNTAIERQNSVKENYELQLKQKQEQVDYYKDLKSRMSTKMIGETLEIHCNTEFSRMRYLFPNAYFVKDNDASGGS